MIFATVGSSHLGFPRLIAALGSLDVDEELVVQYGPVEPPPGATRADSFLPFERIQSHMEAATAVICHAGVGSVLCALRCGHTPLVVPRLARHSETVDDHQVELAKALGESGRVIPVLDVAELSSLLGRVPPRRLRLRVGERPLHRAVRAALLGQAHRADDDRRTCLLV